MKDLDGVLLLTAGFGKRAEPLSFLRPKALLPFRDQTLLGLMAREAGRLDPNRLSVNASRCPDLVLEETQRASRRHGVELLFEERPLGAAATLAGLAGTMTGPWMLMNTDMTVRADLEGLFSHHRSSGALCTLLCGDFPPCGNYGSVVVDGVPRHYMGVCVIEPEAARRAARLQGFQGLLSPLIIGEPAAYEQVEEWADMGEADIYRRNLLVHGGFIHPGASVSPGASLLGNCHVSKGCVVESGAVILDSVMLEGSSVSAGTRLENSVLPWFAHRSGCAHHK
ncbi:MAG: NDP-sugar synthase [Candidatus Fermentibacteraceae bacterium]